MKFASLFIFNILLISVVTQNINAQSFGAHWKCDYSTWDDEPNSIGYNTISVATISENIFVALARRGTNSTSYLVGYSNADSAKGRMGYYAYAPAGYEMSWVNGFDFVSMLEAYDIAATPDSLIYVANNDADRNILVFKMTQDSIVSTGYRMTTKATGLWGIDVDFSGRVYVTQPGDSVTKGQILIYKSIQEDGNWGILSDTPPVYTITLPDPGEIRGVTVNTKGTLIYASNYTNKKIYCYTGSPSTGYSLYSGFNFTLTDTKVASDNSILTPGPWGLKYMNQKNILFMTAAMDFKGGVGYEYGKIFEINPNTGAILDTIDVAQWNYDKTGSYQTRGGNGTTPGNASGYTSVYNVDYDQNFNIYSQSYYGWAVDKWTYNGTLPTVPVTITSVIKTNTKTPSDFSLLQNYPNPFNPSTTIEFSVKSESEISLAIYSVTGELVTEVIKNRVFQNGTYKVTLDASRLASGAYFYTLKTKNNQYSKKMIVLK